MKRTLNPLLLTGLLMIGGCRVSSNEMASPPSSPGRWQVIQTEYGNAKQAVLLDTYTGETWTQTSSDARNFSWKPAKKLTD